MGIGFSKSLSIQTTQELSRYLTDYLSLAQGQTQQVFLSMAGLYVRYVAVAFFLGFVSIGVCLLPLLTLAYGGLLSFSVCALVATYGTQGVWVALALLGMRTLVGIPCYLWVAVEAQGASYGLAQLCLGIKRSTRPMYNGMHYIGFCLCIALLLAGVCMDFWLSPNWLVWAMAQVCQ